MDIKDALENSPRVTGESGGISGEKERVKINKGGVGYEQVEVIRADVLNEEGQTIQTTEAYMKPGVSKKGNKKRRRMPLHIVDTVSSSRN